MTISRRWVGCAVILAAPFLFCSLLWGQIDKGTINGSVVDPSGAVIPDVKVVATNVETGVNYLGATNGVGLYSIRALPIGHYSLHFEKLGFKNLDRTGLALEVGQVAEINVKLGLGTGSETVAVSSTLPVLETETTAVSTVMDAKAMADLPLNFGGGRDVTQFVYTNVPTTSGGNWSGHIGGSQDMSKNVMVDGTDATSGLQGFVQNIGMEAVEEMDVQVSGIGAEGARTGGGAILMELKSGTNQFHGSAYYFLENEALDANTWANNFFLSQCGGDPQCRADNKRPRDRFNDWGFSAGGPIWKNHTFIFGAWERYRNVTLAFAPNQATVPTTDFLTGNFSALLGGPLHLNNDPNQPIATDPCTGETILSGQIYDPQAMYTNGNGDTCHVPFNGNIIPPDRISTLAKSVVDNVYRKGYAPARSGLINNFPAFAGNAGQTNEHLDLKVDHNLSKTQRIAVSYNWWTLPYTGSGGLWERGNTSSAGPLSTGLTQTQKDQSIRAQHFYNISPTLLNTFSIVFNQHRAIDSPPTPFDAGPLGFTGTNGKNFPNINFLPGVDIWGGDSGAVNGISERGIGSPYSDGYSYYNYSFSDTVSWVRGRHSFKFGGDFQARGMNSWQDGGIRSYTFSNTTGAPVDDQISPFIGFAFANFLLGDVQTADQSVTFYLHGRRKFISLFAADDIKVNSKLTLSASLRWDVNSRFHEKDGKWSNFDLNAQNPLWQPYKGAWTWTKNGSDSFEKNQDFHQFGPHLGAAYQLRNNLVLRGAYGIFYTPLALNQWNGVAFGRNGGAYGFVGSNNVPNFVQDAVGFQWDAGYPGQDVFPERSITQTDVSGGAATIWPDALHMGMTQNWNAGVQYLLSKDAVLSLNYIGNHGSQLHDAGPWPYNFPTQATYLKLYNSGHAEDWIESPADAAAAGVSYPFDGFAGYAYQAINPYPQLASQDQGVQLVNANLAVSSYRALVAEIKTRGAHGLTADLNYTWSRSQGNGSDAGNYSEGWGTNWSQDPYMLKNLGDQVSSWNHTHEVKGYVDYALPFGKGRKWATNSRALDSLVGGWNIGVELSYHSGEPLPIVGSSNSYPGWDGVFTVRNPSVGLGNPFKRLDLNWDPTLDGAGSDPNSLFFNPNAFSNPAPGQFSPEKYALLDYWHTWAYFNEDVSILKKFHFGKEDRFIATLRAQFFDVFNRHHWDGPNTDITSPYFGHVTGVSGQRFGQIGARLEW